MKDNRIKFDNEAVSLLKTGVDKLANAVKSTLGPSGKNVIIIKEDGTPSITKDGVSVAKAINLEDKFENAGAQIVKEVAEKTLKNIGDNTTTATVLAQSFINNGLKKINKFSLIRRSNGSKALDMKKGIDLAVGKVVECLKAQSKTITKDSPELLNVAKISANNDTKVAEMVVEAFKHTGNDGIILLETIDDVETEVEYVDGVQYDRGFLKEFFVNDTEKRICRLENPYILFYFGRMADTEILSQAFSFAFQQSRPLVVIAKDVYGNAIYNMEYNKQQCLAIQADGTAGYKRKYMEDLAVVTGGGVFDERDIFDVKKLGQCDTVIADEFKTIFIGGRGNEEEIEKQAQLVRKQAEDTKDEYIKQIIKKRLARIKGGVATIKIGGYTEIEKKEKYDRFDDSVCATRAALKDGVVVGGGMAYIKCIDKLKELKRYFPSSYKDAFNVTISAIQEPFKQIVRNCGKNPDKILNEVLKYEGDYVGYNGLTDSIENLTSEGIIDATGAVINAIENAASIAGLFLTTECIVNNEQGSLI
jgi:chaperonin GroEL